MDHNLSGINEDQLNSILKGENVKIDLAPNTPPTPAAAAEGAAPATPPAATTPEPVTPTPAATTPAAATDAAPVTTPPATTEPPAATPPAVDFSALTNGKFKSADELNSFLQEQDKLQQELNRIRTESQFRSDRAKTLFELVNKIDGMPEESVEKYLRVSKLNLEGLTAQQARFEAFMLDPKTAQIASAGKLSQDDLKEAFLERDFKLYGDPNDQENPRSKTQLLEEQFATQEALAQLAKMKENLKQAEGPAVKTPEEIAKEQLEYREFVQAQLLSFGEVGMKVSATDPDGKKIETAIAIKLDKTLHDAAVEYASDPMGAWDEELLRTGAMNEKGEVDIVKLGSIMTEFKNRQFIYNQIYTQGRQDMLAEMVKNHRNPPTPPIGATPPPVTPVVKKSDVEMIAEQAFQVAGAGR